LVRRTSSTGYKAHARTFARIGSLTHEASVPGVAMIPVVAPPLHEPSGRSRWSRPTRKPVQLRRGAQPWPSAATRPRPVVNDRRRASRPGLGVVCAPNRLVGVGHRARTCAVSLGVCAAMVAIIASRRRFLEN
jgi:hypothetical protein